MDQRCYIIDFALGYPELFKIINEYTKNHCFTLLLRTCRILHVIMIDKKHHDSNRALEYFAHNNYVNCLDYVNLYNELHSIETGAAEGGHLSLLLYAKNKARDHMHYSAHTIYYHATMAGHLDIIIWAFINEPPFPLRFCESYAPLYGHLEILLWYKYSLSCGSFSRIIDTIASRGYLDIIIWISQFEQINASLCINAVNYNMHHIVYWMHYSGHLTNKDTHTLWKIYKGSIENDSVELFQWFKITYPIELKMRKVCIIAAKHNSLQILNILDTIYVKYYIVEIFMHYGKDIPEWLINRGHITDKLIQLQSEIINEGDVYLFEWLINRYDLDYKLVYDQIIDGMEKHCDFSYQIQSYAKMLRIIKHKI